MAAAVAAATSVRPPNWGRSPFHSSKITERTIVFVERSNSSMRIEQYDCLTTKKKAVVEQTLLNILHPCTQIFGLLP